MVVVRRALEHQVLEQMREAGQPGPLVLRADVIPDVHGHDRQRVILVQDDVETVGERGLGVGDLHAGDRAPQRTGVSGIVARVAARSRCCAATRSAAANDAPRAGAESGSPMTIGTPLSPPDAHRLVERDAAEERHAQLGRQPLRRRPAEEVALAAAARADEVAHVLDQAERRDVELLGTSARRAAYRPATPLRRGHDAPRPPPAPTGSG